MSAIVLAAGSFVVVTGPGAATGGTAPRATALVTPSPPSSTTVAVSLASATCVKRSDVASWPLRDRAANLVMVGVPITQVNEAIAVVRREGLGGILIRGTLAQASGAKLRLLRDSGRHGPAFVAVD